MHTSAESVYACLSLRVMHLCGRPASGGGGGGGGGGDPFCGHLSCRRLGHSSL